MVAGPCPCFVLAAVIRGGKTMPNGKVGYCGSVRHKLPQLCPHGLLALYLCFRFTVKGEQFPMPSTDDQQWFHTALWKGNGPRANISYEQQLKSWKATFKESKILTKKITHAPRVCAARFLDDHGTEDAVCALWILPALSSHLHCSNLVLHRSLSGWAGGK